MITLSIGVSKKQQGEEQYSSVGANCSISCEASDELVKNPPALQTKIAALFEEVKTAVDQQIANGNGKANGNGRVNGNGGGNRTRVTAAEEKKPEEWIPKPDPNNPIITPKQRQFLVALVQKRFKGGIKAFEAHLREEGITSVSMLTRRQASQIIDDLAGKNGNGNGKGGER